MSAAVSRLTLRYFGFDDYVASCKSAKTCLWLACVYCTYVHCIQTIFICEFSLHTMWGLCKCKYSIHLFNSVHICALWFCEALACEMSVCLTFLALELGRRTVESWSVSCVSTAFTYVWIKGRLRFWFLLFLSLSVWLPLLRVWLRWLFCLMALQMLM